MRISIRVRMLVLTNLLVIATAVGVGYLGSEVAGEVVEERLMRQTVSRTVEFIRGRNIPFSDTLMAYLSEMFGAEFITVRPAGGEVVGSSVPPEQTRRLHAVLAAGERSGTLTLGETHYRYESHDIPGVRLAGAPPADLRLYAVAPQSQFAAARARARSRVVAVTIPAAAAATVLAFALSITITRPIRRLADEMDHTARGEPAERRAGRRQSPREGPAEIARLAESFDHLMARLADAREELARAERLATLGRVAASVAHELRNPLSGIKMHVRVLEDSLPAEDRERAGLEVIAREIDRMELYLHELMQVAAGEPGTAAEPAAREPVALGAVADSVLALMERRCRHAGVEVVREYAADAPPALADAERARQVLMNLIVNALEAMAGGGTLRVTVEGGTDGAAAVEVADTGGGLDPELADPFEPFATTKRGGAGLGLYLCRRIAESLGGRIAHRATEAGAAFRLELPAAGAEA